MYYSTVCYRAIYYSSVLSYAMYYRTMCCSIDTAVQCTTGHIIQNCTHSTMYNSQYHVLLLLLSTVPCGIYYSVVYCSNIYYNVMHNSIVKINQLCEVLQAHHHLIDIACHLSHNNLHNSTNNLYKNKVSMKM